MSGFDELDLRIMRLSSTFVFDAGDVPAETVRIERRGWLATVDDLRAQVDALKAEEKRLREILQYAQYKMGAARDLVADMEAALRDGEGPVASSGVSAAGTETPGAAAATVPTPAPDPHKSMTAEETGRLKCGEYQGEKVEYPPPPASESDPRRQRRTHSHYCPACKGTHECDDDCMGQSQPPAATDGVPAGYSRVEAYSNGREIVVVGDPPDEDGVHNCDEMGCSTVSHVIYRAALDALRRT